MAKRQELAPMLLNQIRITRKKEKQNDGDKDQKEQPGIYPLTLYHIMMNTYYLIHVILALNVCYDDKQR